MKSKRLVPVALLFIIAALGLAMAGCERRSTQTDDPTVEYYTCTMHPSVKSHDPKAKCPICSMNLVPVKKKSGASNTVASPGHEHSHVKRPRATNDAAVSEAPGEFVVPVARQQQIGVTYATVTNKPLHSTMRAVGTVMADRKRHWDFVSRVEGYVQKIEVASRGEVVEKNQPLLTIYSPELLTTQREFLDMLQMRNKARDSGSEPASASADRLLESVKRRLVRWNITGEQIAELEKSGQATETLTLFSPFKGIIQDLQAGQGRRVMPGDRLVEVADLSVVWVWAEFYQDELPLLKPELAVNVTTSSYPGEPFAGRIALIDPFLSETKRTGRVRLDVDNPQFKLRPDMYVDVALDVDLGEGLTVPVSAVLPTGERSVVFVDKGEGKLEPRFIEVVRKVGADYVVKSGLMAGERVVNSANFLIDAESKVQGALKSF